MAGSAGSIYVDLLLKDAKYVEGINRARKSTKDFSRNTKTELDSTAKSFTGISSSISALGGVLAGAFSVQKIIQYSDAFKNLESRLRLVTGSASEAARVQSELFNIAQENSQPFEQIVAGYTRLSASLKESQKDQYDLIRINELLSKTLLISGADATAAATFFQQFGQAASSDFKAIGQELQTFADQNPAFYKILNDEANKYGKTLKQLAEEGRLSFDFIAQSTLNAGDMIDEQAESLSQTIGKSFTELQNSLMNFIGDSSKVSEVTDILAGSVSGLASGIDSLGTSLDNVAPKIQKFLGDLDKGFFDFLDNVDRFLGRDPEALSGRDTGSLFLDDSFYDAFLGEEGSSSSRKAPPIGAGKPNKSKGEDAFKKRQRELQSLYEKNRDLIFSLDKATVDYIDTSNDLYELQKEGIISYEQLNVALRNLSDEYDKNSEKAEIWGVDIETFGKRAAENIQDAFADFLFDPFEQGLDGMLKGFVDTVRKMIAEAQAAKLAKGLFGELAGGEGEGFLGGLFGNLFGGGGSKGIANPNIVGSQYMFADGGYLPPGKFGIAGEAGAELLYGGNTGISVFNQDQIGSARKGGNTYNIDARGTDSSVVARLEQSILALAGPGQIEKRVFNAQRRGSL